MLSALQPSPGGGGEATTGLAESMEKRRVLEHLPRIASGFNSGPAHLPPVGTISPALKHNWNLPCTAKPSPVFWLFLHVRSQISGGVSFLPASPVPAARHPGFSRLSAGLSALHRPRGACRAQGSGREGSQGRLVLRHQVPQSPVSREDAAPRRALAAPRRAVSRQDCGPSLSADPRALCSSGERSRSALRGLGPWRPSGCRFILCLSAMRC